MPAYTLKAYPKDVEAAATPLHDKSSSQGYNHLQESFVIQASGGDVHLGDSTVTSTINAFTIPEGKSVNITGLLSRGTRWSYDLSELYYVGGPFKLVIERKVE